MSNNSSRLPRRYKQLGDFLLGSLGEQNSQSWLAKHVYVSQEAVHYWCSGKSRPAPDHLGQVAAVLGLRQSDVFTLAELANYDVNPNNWDKVLTSYADRRLAVETQTLTQVVNNIIPVTGIIK